MIYLAFVQSRALYWIVGNTSEQDYSMLLRIEGKDFPMSEATLLEGSKRGQIYYWKDHGLSWQVGGAVVVAVYHLPDAPVVELPSMKLAGAVQDLEMTSTEGGFLDLSWREPENADEVGVEAYEVYVKETDQPWSDARRLVVPRSHGRASTGGASQRNAKNQGTEQQTTRSDGTPGGGNASPDRGRQPLPKSECAGETRGRQPGTAENTGRDSEHWAGRTNVHS